LKEEHNVDLSTVQNALRSNLKLLKRRHEKKTGQEETTFTRSKI
jgi:hypothetical protein